MTEKELPEDEGAGTPDDDAPDLPPPSTFAGKARQGGNDAGEAAEAPEPDPTDEEEEPPDEFAFEDDEESLEDDEPEDEPEAGPGSGQEAEPAEELAGADPEGEGEAAEEPAEGSGPTAEDPSADPADDTVVAQPPAVSSATVEADTLTLADIEAQREAAHAGLAARAKSSSFSHEVTTGSHKAQPPATPPAGAGAAVAADEADEGGVGEPPKRRIGWRFMAGAFVIVSSMAAATAVSFLLFLSDIAAGLNDSGLSAARAQLDEVEGGAPQTILVLGSDKRESLKGDPGRSDTAMLIRVDPDKEFLSLMSLPRDLQVPIPGYGTEKLNAAYTYGEQENPGGGGTELALRTIKEYLDIPINHVVNVDFTGFYEAVNAIDCVYIDVDRHYFHSNEGILEGSTEFYSEIDVPAGYSKLCGYRALQYVRYRHGDNDLVRGARQQDFIREARQRIPPTKLLPVFGQGDELIDIFTKNTSSDINDVPTIIAMMKSFVSVRNAPVRQVSLGELSADNVNVVASGSQVDSAVDQFLGNDLDDVPADKPAGSKSGGGRDKEKPKPEPPAQDPLIDFAGPAQAQAAEFQNFFAEKKVDLPIFYPTRIVETTNPTISDDSRAAPLAGPNNNEVFHMYKFVIPFQDTFGPSYYGVSGTDWTDPPILKNPSEERTIDGREYLLFYEQDRLRLVGWRTPKGSYWVINTLTQALTESQMLELATSTRELGR